MEVLNATEHEAAVTAEFRAEAVKLVLEQKAGLAEVARRLELPAKSLANWVRAGKRVGGEFAV
jgi:transposase-like protein